MEPQLPPLWQISSRLDLLPPLWMKPDQHVQLLRNPPGTEVLQPCECPSICSSFTPKMSLEPCSAKSHSSLPPAARCRSFRETRHLREVLLEISRLVGNCDLRTEMN